MTSFVTADMRDLDRLSRNLGAYMNVRHTKTEDEILNQKGTDLSIQLGKQFISKRWKRGRAALSTTLKRILKHGGIYVRRNSLESRWISAIPNKTISGKPLNTWQKLVAQEVARRRSGVGVLGVGFFSKRWNKRKGTPKFLIVNRTKGFGQAVRIEKGPHFYSITGFTPGMAEVAQRYGILGAAIQKVSADIETYLARKMGAAFVEEMHAR